MVAVLLTFVRAQVATVIVDVPEDVPDDKVEGWANWGYCGRSPIEHASCLPPEANLTRFNHPWKLQQRAPEPPPIVPGGATLRKAQKKKEGKKPKRR